MATRLHRALPLVAALLFALPSFASAYDGRPRLIVIVIVDQLRGDYLARYQDRFGPGGFNLFLQRGAVFTECHYDYASTRTAPSGSAHSARHPASCAAETAYTSRPRPIQPCAAEHIGQCSPEV